METIAVPADLAAILLLGLGLGEAYAHVLRPIQHVYNPHWTWLTVVVGTVLTWIVYALLAARGYVPWHAAGWFIGVFCLTGFGVLRWQLLQLRDHQRRQKVKNDHAPQNARGSRGPGSTP